MPAGNKRHTFLFFTFLVFLVLLLAAFNRLLQYTASVPCTTHTDLLHPYFNARDFSAFIFPITYIPVAIFIVFNLKRIDRLNFFMLGYCLLLLTRMLSIYFLPFCEPAGAIQLHDYLLNTLFYPGGYCAVDLFYSGHTATLFLLALAMSKPWKTILLVLTGVLAVLLVWQKVHYTVDVLAAIPVTWLCFALAKKLHYFTSNEKYTAR